MYYRTKAYAKVNIGLKIIGKRDDGYHLISSYFLLIPLYDEIEVEIKEGSGCSIIGNEGYLTSKEDLMAKAARLYKDRTGLEFSLNIKIKKNIPSEAGLGGGSSDASAVLKLLNSHFNKLSDTDLMELSKDIGADVPFFVSGFKFAYCGGIGEIVEKKEFPIGYEYISLFREGKSAVSTKDAYKKLDEKGFDSRPLGEITYPIRREAFPNDFEKIEKDNLFFSLQNELETDDYFSLSGSGSVWFLLSKNKWRGSSNNLLFQMKI